MAHGGPKDVDISKAQEARLYDYWLGGKDSFAPDRALGDMIKERIPTISEMARANRAFLVRSVRYLAGEAGISQFLDIGTGIPTAPNVHQVAQGIHPTARVLYLDKDPLVLAKARALMASTKDGRTAFVLGDFSDIEQLLDGPELRKTLDFGTPMAVLLIAVLVYLDGELGVDPYPLVRRAVDALPSGSYVALSHPTADFDPAAMAGVRGIAERAGISFVPRSKDEVAAFLDGLELVAPGLVPVLSWRPDGSAPLDPHAAYYWAGVGRKP